MFSALFIASKAYTIVSENDLKAKREPHHWWPPSICMLVAAVAFIAAVACLITSSAAFFFVSARATNASLLNSDLSHTLVLIVERSPNE